MQDDKTTIVNEMINWLDDYVSRDIIEKCAGQIEQYIRSGKIELKQPPAPTVADDIRLRYSALATVRMRNAMDNNIDLKNTSVGSDDAAERILDGLYNPSIFDLERDEYQDKERDVVYLDDVKAAIAALRQADRDEVLQGLSVGSIHEAERNAKLCGAWTKQGAFIEGFRFARNQLQNAKNKLIAPLEKEDV